MKKVKRSDIDEMNIYDSIKTIVMEEVKIIQANKNKNGRDSDDFKNLFMLARTYAILKNDLRDDIKFDTLKSLGIDLED